MSAPDPTINPGVQRLVAWLNAHGFETTDSGDGQTNIKAGIEDALNYPHVAMVVSVAPLLVDEADRLRALLEENDIHVGAVGDPDSVWIEASYDPATGTPVIFLSNLDDAGLDG